ncbi:hypothetical protein RNZ50_13345 [Paracoccaceae bacterium Fryx2]|nr:hypothetical protein [Paracoccaceae bacterium Fryx2]
MKTLAGAVGALALGATAATAGGIDRSGQNIGVLFEKGRYAELSFGHVTPDVTGVDNDGNATGNVAGSFTPLSFAYKYDINDQVSFAVILDQPFGADIAYGARAC